MVSGLGCRGHLEVRASFRAGGFRVWGLGTYRHAILGLSQRSPLAVLAHQTLVECSGVWGCGSGVKGSGSTAYGFGGGV